MILPSELRRLALLLAFLPQLLLLGLGQRVVLCIAPGGHSQVEVATSACCVDLVAVATAPGEDLVIAQDEPDCGPCSDYRIVVDPGFSRESAAGVVQLASAATAALPLENATLRVAEPTHSSGRLLDRGHVQPHLIHLRSTMLRC